MHIEWTFFAKFVRANCANVFVLDMLTIVVGPHRFCREKSRATKVTFPFAHFYRKKSSLTLTRWKWTKWNDSPFGRILYCYCQQRKNCVLALNHHWSLIIIGGNHCPMNCAIDCHISQMIIKRTHFNAHRIGLSVCIVLSKQNDGGKNSLWESYLVACERIHSNAISMTHEEIWRKKNCCFRGKWTRRISMKCTENLIFVI